MLALENFKRLKVINLVTIDIGLFITKFKCKYIVYLNKYTYQTTINVIKR